jgi:caffeoyl-CoA O-methyltransferase
MASNPDVPWLDPAVSAYASAHSTPQPDDVQRALIEETRALGGISIMQIAPEQGIFMTMLTWLVGARDAVEIGIDLRDERRCVRRRIVVAKGPLVSVVVS